MYLAQQIRGYERSVTSKIKVYQDVLDSEPPQNISTNYHEIKKIVQN